VQRRRIIVTNRLGVHARVAARLVTTATTFVSEVKLGHQGETLVDARSIMAVLMLAAGQGSELELEACGADEQEALDALCHVINENLDHVD